MQYKILGKTNLKTSVIGFGCNQLGSANWGFKKFDKAQIAIHKAIELGVNHFDTADVYGNRISEEWLGNILEGKRKKIILSTKAGLTGDGGRNGTREHLTYSINNSLKKLRTDYIDIFYLHRPDPNVPLEESLDTIVEFIRAGKVRFGGVSQLNPNLLKSIRGNQAVSCLQYCLNFFENKTINAIDAQIEHEQYGLVTYSPFASGWIFNKKYRKLANSTYPFFKKGYYRSEFPLYSRLFQLAEKSNVSLKSMALNWIMRNEKVNTILVGASTQQQVEENAMVNVYSMQSDLLTKIDNLVAKYSPQKRFVRSFMWRIGVGLARGKIRMINQKVR